LARTGIYHIHVHFYFDHDLNVKYNFYFKYNKSKYKYDNFTIYLKLYYNQSNDKYKHNYD
jgi:hypothetical protein